MTTIAWDGKTLAADRQSTYGNVKVESRKIRDCGPFVFALAGEKDNIETIAGWIAQATPAAGRAPLKEGGMHGIAVRKEDGAAFSLEGERATMIRVYAGKFAAGSGFEFALAAMTLGKTAVQAVVFASRFDMYSGLGVDSVRIRPSKR